MSRYKFVCTCKNGSAIGGTYVDNAPKFNRDELTQKVMRTVVEFVIAKNIPWDPFNTELVVQAHKEPKP